MSGRRKTDTEGIDHALELTALEAARRAARKVAWSANCALAIIFVTLLVGVTVYQQLTNRRLDRSEMRACERVQLQRERTNVSEARQYRILSAAIANPRAPRNIRDRFEVLARTTLYDPPTDCAMAVSHPNSYRRPPSVPFYSLPTVYVEAVIRAAKEQRPQPVPHP